MPLESEILYRDREQVELQMIDDFRARLPDVYTGKDGNLRMLLSVLSGVYTSVFLANQVLSDDMFVKTANIVALTQYGVQYGRPRKNGTTAEGLLKFSGAGGTLINIGTEVAYDPMTGGELLYFNTTESATLPNPGDPAAPTPVEMPVPAAPTVAVGSATGMTGIYEYKVTFDFTGPESPPSAASSQVTVSNQKVNLTVIPLGPTGTTARQIYRKKSSNSVWKKVGTISDNTTTVYTDSASDATESAGLAAPAAGVLSGTYEYAVTFVTLAGETLLGAESNAVVTTTNSAIKVTLPVGGTGTTARKLYRSLAGADYLLVTTVEDNVTLVYRDNISSPGPSTAPLADSALAITVAGVADNFGTAYNVSPNTIRELVSVPGGITDVTNPEAFTGGTDQEPIEEFRGQVLKTLQNPATGSPRDLKSWAEEIEGVGTATVFTNDNAGTPTNGHATVRITGVGGALPSVEIQNAVLAALELQDMANITLHVTTFDQLLTDVEVEVTVDTDYSLEEVTPTVQKAISDYINSLEVGETMRVSAIIDAVYGLSGVLDVEMVTPTTNQTTGDTEKRVADEITVS